MYQSPVITVVAPDAITSPQLILSPTRAADNPSIITVFDPSAITKPCTGNGTTTHTWGIAACDKVDAGKPSTITVSAP